MIQTEKGPRAAATATEATQSANFKSKYSPAEILLSRLDRVAQRGEGRWLACCPAHFDRKPSLAVKETADGTLLVKCWSGCCVSEIVEAMGLKLKDLFPRDDADRSPLPRHRRFPALDVLAAIEHEVLIVGQAANAIATRPITDEERDRLNLAASRILTAVQEVRGHGKRWQRDHVSRQSASGAPPGAECWPAVHLGKRS